MEKEENKGETGMTLLGWIFFLVSWACILGLAGFCFVKIFEKKKID
jgi:hypothetical protein